ncbi:hypothetical protein IQ07DRAFT_592665 [Pyrenochaeta sp. DS3sAY3a]|nr:hypothetical protein IQ07DRAFT_592665 [Pyrenochaeta sp. DS3sAY3a]
MVKERRIELLYKVTTTSTITPSSGNHNEYSKAEERIETIVGPGRCLGSRDQDRKLCCRASAVEYGGRSLVTIE